MLRVFEAFAGYGSQRMALRNLKIPFKVVGISEIEKDVLLSYAAIHTDFLQKRKTKPQITDKRTRQILAALEKKNVPLDYKTFKNKARSFSVPALYDFYLANKLCRNFGDISKINPEDLPDFDLFTYSFPCQDISVAGYQHGLNRASGTRSSLLWECCKIIKAKQPRYLMMENVKNLVGTNHKHNFNQFLNYLSSLGYRNFWGILNAKDYGIPQHRERVFCISILGDSKGFRFPARIPLKYTLQEILEPKVCEKFYLNNGQTLDTPIKQEISYCIDANYWKGVTLKSFLTKHRRQVVTDGLCENGKCRVRRLTPRETWRLMGVSDADFNKARQLVSNTSLYRQAGNSIVVPVLEAIFRELFVNAFSALPVNLDN